MWLHVRRMWLHVSGHMPLDCLRRYRSFEDLTSLLPSPLGASSKLNFRELRYGEVRRIPLLGTSVNKPPADVSQPAWWHHVHGG
jgi:hypothetical protein